MHGSVGAILYYRCLESEAILIVHLRAKHTIGQLRKLIKTRDLSGRPVSLVSATVWGLRNSKRLCVRMV